MDSREVGCDPGYWIVLAEDTVDPVYWIVLAEDRDKWWAYVRAVMNLRVPEKPIS